MFLITATLFTPSQQLLYHTGNHWIKWDNVLKTGPSKICGRQPLKYIGI